MPTEDPPSGTLSLRGVVSAGLGVTLIGLVLSGNLGSRTSVIFSALGFSQHAECHPDPPTDKAFQLLAFEIRLRMIVGR